MFFDMVPEVKAQLDKIAESLPADPEVHKVAIPALILVGMLISDMRKMREAIERLAQ